MLYARAFSLLTDKFNKKILTVLSQCVEEMCRGEINELKKPIPVRVKNYILGLK